MTGTQFPDGALDHSAFPHILDLILNHADAPTLLLLARTSKDIRARVHPHLYRHVALCSDHTTIVHLPCPPWSVLTIVDRSSADDEWDAQNGPASNERDGGHPAQHALRETQCVDLGSSVFHAPDLHLPDLRMIRMAVAGVRSFPPWPRAHPARIVSVPISQPPEAAHASDISQQSPASPAYLPFDAWSRVQSRIFVTHMDLLTWPPQPAWLYDLEYSDEEEGSSYHASRPSAVLQVAMPSDTQRLVLHLHWSGPLRTGTDVQILPQALAEYADIVVVLHSPSGQTEEGMDDGWFSLLLQHLVKVAVQRRARVYIVGAERCTDAQLGMRPRRAVRGPVAKWQRDTPRAPPPLRSGEVLVAAVRRQLESTFERAWCDVTRVQMDACRAMWPDEGETVGDIEGLGRQVRLVRLEEWEALADSREVEMVGMPSEVVLARARERWAEKKGE